MLLKYIYCFNVYRYVTLTAGQELSIEQSGYIAFNLIIVQEQNLL